MFTTYTSQGNLVSNVLTHYTVVIISDKRGVTKQYRDMTGDWVIIEEQLEIQ